MKKDIKSTNKENISEKLKNMTDAMKKKKAEILTVANDFADRVILKAIEKEENAKKWAEVDKKNKEKSDKILVEKADAKRKRKASRRITLNKTIPSGKALEVAKKQQEELKTKFYDAEAKKLAKIEEKRVAREARKKSMEKKKLTHLKTHKEGIKLTRTTKEQRITAAKQSKLDGYLAFDKEMQRQSAEIMADRAGYGLRLEKRKKNEAERLAMLAEKRKSRKDKLVAVGLCTTAKVKSDIKHFLKAEESRKAKKLAKTAKYLTKGGIEVPKVKNKVALNKERAAEYIKNAEKAANTEKTRYIIRISSVNETSKIMTDSVRAFMCTAKELPKRIKEVHNNYMKEEKDTYIGTYAYEGAGKAQKCVYEMINDAHKDEAMAHRLTRKAA
jgi:hypothetical protein